MEELDKIFENVEVSEPGALEKVILVQEMRRKEDEEYIKLLVEKLDGCEITWPRPWYQKSNCLTRKTRAPCAGEETYNTGALTLIEREKVFKNWTKFVREFEVPDSPKPLARWKNKNKNKNKSPEEFVRYFVTAYLARGLKRDLYQINRHFINGYGYSVKLGKYTPTEEKIMKICFEHSPDDAVPILSAVLGREPRGLYKRLDQYYDGKPERNRLKWSLKLATKFINYLMQFSGSTLQDLCNRDFSIEIWKRIEKEMGQKHCYLREHWFGKLHVQLFAKCEIKSTPLRRIICKKLKKSPYKIWSDIRWKQLVKEFPDGFTHSYLHRMTKSLFEKIPDYVTIPLSEVISKALSCKKNWRRRSTKSLELVNGKLKYVKHEQWLRQVMLHK